MTLALCTAHAADFSNITVERTLNGHSASVYALAAQNGASLVASASGAYVQLLEVSGAVQATLVGHRSDVTALSWQRGGKTLASGGSDGRVRFWNAPNWKEVRAIAMPEEASVTALEFSPDGARLAVGLAGGGLRLYEASGRFLRAFEGHERSVRALGWNVAGKLLASGDDRGAAFVWDAGTAKRLKQLPAISSAVRNLLFGADGKVLYRATLNGQLAGFDTTKYAPLKLGFTLDSGITSLSFGSSLAALTTVDGEVFVWDFKSSKPALLGEHTDVAITSSWSGDTLYTGGSDANIRVWDGKLKREVRVLRSIGSHANDLSFNADGTLLASVSSDTDVLVWDVVSGALKQTLKGTSAWIESVEFAPKGNLLAAGYDDGSLRLFDTVTGQVRHEIETEESYLNTVGFSPNGKFLVTGGGEGRVHVFDVQSGKSLRTQPRSGDSVFEAAWSPDGSLIGVALESGAVHVLDADTLEVKTEFEDAEDSIRTLSWSVDGWLAASSFDGSVNVYDAINGIKISSLELQRASALSVTFNPDGQLIAVGGSDGTLRLVDARSGKVMQSYPNHTDVIYSSAFSNDGTRLAVGAGRLETGGSISLYSASGTAVFGVRPVIPTVSSNAPRAPADWSRFNISEGLTLRLSAKFNVSGLDKDRVQIRSTTDANAPVLELRGIGLDGFNPRQTLLEFGLGWLKLDCSREGLRCGDPVTVNTVPTGNRGLAYSLQLSALSGSSSSAQTVQVQAPVLLMDARGTGGETALVIVRLKPVAASATTTNTDPLALLRDFAANAALEASE
jgi:WD40 repeat protein